MQSFVYVIFISIIKGAPSHAESVRPTFSWLPLWDSFCGVSEYGPYPKWWRKDALSSGRKLKSVSQSAFRYAHHPFSTDTISRQTSTPHRVYVVLHSHTNTVLKGGEFKRSLYIYIYIYRFNYLNQNQNILDAGII